MQDIIVQLFKLLFLFILSLPVTLSYSLLIYTAFDSFRLSKSREKTMPAFVNQSLKKNLKQKWHLDSY